MAEEDVDLLKGSDTLWEAIKYIVPESDDITEAQVSIGNKKCVVTYDFTVVDKKLYLKGVTYGK